MMRRTHSPPFQVGLRRLPFQASLATPVTMAPRRRPREGVAEQATRQEAGDALPPQQTQPLPQDAHSGIVSPPPPPPQVKMRSGERPIRVQDVGEPLTHSPCRLDSLRSIGEHPPMGGHALFQKTVALLRMQVREVDFHIYGRLGQAWRPGLDVDSTSAARAYGCARTSETEHHVYHVRP
ncbi:hypothetical protein Taro_045886 [Colocasia esculenta]|uniref:Uncharacterized protein n=1 Tax=Colocasia esculenta TaxID=4460 RepID=A0A843X4V4_COLES|nr:hypothetical protein [Colocasia esculenta]